MILLSQDVNGILLPIILVYVLKIVNDESVMGDYVNSRAYNVVAPSPSPLIALTVVLLASALPLGFRL